MCMCMDICSSGYFWGTSVTIGTAKYTNMGSTDSYVARLHPQDGSVLWSRHWGVRARVCVLLHVSNPPASFILPKPRLRALGNSHGGSGLTHRGRPHSNPANPLPVDVCAISWIEQAPPRRPTKPLFPNQSTANDLPAALTSRTVGAHSPAHAHAPPHRGCPFVCACTTP